MTSEKQLPDADVFDVAVLLDGKPGSFPFSFFQAQSKSTQWTAKENLITFAFDPGTSGYLVQLGNPTHFSQPHLNWNTDVTNIKAIDIKAHVGHHDLSKGRVGLFCFLCDDKGIVFDKRRIDLLKPNAQESVTIPSKTASLSFAIRLEGAGSFGGLNIDVTRIARSAAVIKKAQEKALVAKNATETAALATALIANRDYNKGIDLLSTTTDHDHKDRKLLLRCHSGQHEFQQVVDEYEALTPRRKSDVAARLLYLVALANLGMKDKAIRLIEDHCLNILPEQKNIEFMATIYPFAVSLSEKLAERILARIVNADIAWSTKSVNSLIRCAHDLIGESRYAEFHILVDRLYSMELQSAELAKLDILSAHNAFLSKRYDKQLEFLNKSFATYNVAPIESLDAENPIVFDKIACPAAAAQSVDGPKVSVLMTCYNSHETIEYAIRSLMAQTYKNLEIIVIDDCSPDHSLSIIRRLADEDDRITVLALTKNGGTYVAKNHGLKMATGKFVTCQDSDDWAHPQKIERLAAMLEKNATITACTVQHLRYDSVRGFRSHGGYIRMDASSMMYRREQILEKIGFYDSVRAGADSEFQFRIERTYGKNAIHKLPDLLSLVLWSEKSLSGGGKFAIDDDAGIFSPARNAYRNAFCHWQQSTTDLRVPFPLEERFFKIPEESKP